MSFGYSDIDFEDCSLNYEKGYDTRTMGVMEVEKLLAESRIFKDGRMGCFSGRGCVIDGVRESSLCGIIRK